MEAIDHQRLVQYLPPDGYIDLFGMSTARHTDAARPSLAAVCGTPRLFQVGCAHIPMPARSGATVSIRPHPARRRFQPTVVFIFTAAGDPTYTAVQ